jgi:hypothetical protein
MSVEIPPHVEEILRPYLELLQSWKAKMARPRMHDPGWSGTVKMCLDPAFLRKAALEHRRLITGDIERPGPDLAAAIEAALQLHPRMRRERTEDLSDPWWRAMSYEWNGIAEYHARNSYAGVARRTESSTIPSQKAASSASHSQRKAPFATISPERSSG